MGFKDLFRKNRSRSYSSEGSFSTYTTAPDRRTQAAPNNGGSSTISSLHTGTSYANPPSTGYHHHQHARASSATHYQNQSRAFSSELGSQPSYNTTPSYALANAYNRSTPVLAPAPTRFHSPSPAATATPTPSPPRFRTQSQSHSQPQTQPRPTCRECDTTLTLDRVRNNNKGNKGRLYYRCDRCGEFRAWADLQGVYEQNPLCQCEVPSRLDVSKDGEWYFSCATRQCGFWTRRDWRDNEEAGVGYRGGRSGGGGGRYYDSRVPEMA
ncbi:hypothetical protein BJY01DRAFT_253828 [Aspergillus pseudoustus]|uniref:GRF-like zinc ribbon domain-containing protein n=1 Tax=Aspergillus pseudoustus TaxID=1810923 RepID=A0ABR4IY23_9EURO